MRQACLGRFEVVGRLERMVEEYEELVQMKKDIEARIAALREAIIALVGEGETEIANGRKVVVKKVMRELVDVKKARAILTRLGIDKVEWTKNVEAWYVQVKH